MHGSRSAVLMHDALAPFIHHAARSKRQHQGNHQANFGAPLAIGGPVSRFDQVNSGRQAGRHRQRELTSGPLGVQFRAAGATAPVQRSAAQRRAAPRFHPASATLRSWSQDPSCFSPLTRVVKPATKNNLPPAISLLANARSLALALSPGSIFSLPRHPHRFGASDSPHRQAN